MSVPKILDPVCDMIVDVADARERGLTLQLPLREYAFCSRGCVVTFAGSPETYAAKVDAWLAAGPHADGARAHGHAGELPAIDAGMREWYKACRCCMHDAYPELVERLDAERAAP